uniref:Major facilitator superfamily (MFS) profile domain-containing protein n=1 Tax=Plectus sambesii TaxID=2011161 RepID=A0A914WP60_9BILA
MSFSSLSRSPTLRPSEGVMDGRHSWLVLIAAIVVYTHALGMGTAYGIYFIEFMTEFDVSMSAAALVASIMYGATTATAPISSLLYRRLGSQKTIMLGGLVASFGFFTCSFASSLRQVAFIHGIIGFGFGITTIPIWSVHTEYFDRYRNLALGILTAGGGLGLFIFSPIFTYLINEYTWRGSMLLNAAITLHVVGAGFLIKPLQKTTCKVLLVKDDVSCEKRFPSEKIFLFAMSALCWAGSGQTFYQMMPTLAKHHDISESMMIVITSAIGATDIFARLSAAVLNHTLLRRHTVFLYAMALFMVAMTQLAVSMCASFESFLFAGVCFGCSFGLTLGSYGASAFDVFGFEHFPEVIGIATFACSIGGLTIPVLAGYLGDTYGIVWTFLFAALVAVTGSIGCFALAIRKHLGQSKQLIRSAAA